MNRKASIVMPLENYYHTLFSWSLIQTLWKYGKYELNKTSKVGRVAPNPPLVAGEKGQSVVHLLDLVKGSRPLVVVFGSCTCPVIIAKLDQMLDVHREFGNIADFIMIYVQEAHPYNGWKMEVRFSVMTTHYSLIASCLQITGQNRSLVILVTLFVKHMSHNLDHCIA